MKVLSLSLLVLGVLSGCDQGKPSETVDNQELKDYFTPPGLDLEAIERDSTSFVFTDIAGPDVVPSPSCLAVLPTGEVFVGVDMIGSLGKTPGKGRIMKLVDADNDGEYEQTTTFAKVDNPRGIMAVGDKVYVLYTVFNLVDSLAERMDIVVFEDKNNDGVADGPSKPLITNICSPESIRKRGTDHSTNGIRMGIDGWIYIAVGDFGFHNAEDRSGKKMTMLGGGIVRVRPDGTEMEEYIHGTRNIYDVAIDPFMNVYTRGNTNDGGGWNIRFMHYLQSGEHGYPNLFKNFTDEIIPALVDVGGGSGTGSYFMDDDRWPVEYNHVPMMADWGNSELFIHRVTMDGPTFTQADEKFITLPQITDLDLDGSGRMYLAAWDGAGCKGSPDKGYVIKVVPKGWTYEAFPDLKALDVTELGELLKAGNSVTRFHAQQEMLNRSTDEVAVASLSIAKDKALPLANRVAGIYTYAQATCANGIDALLELCKEDKVREFAIRALADRKGCLDAIPLERIINAALDANPRVQAAAIIALGRLGRVEAAETLLSFKVPASAKIPPAGVEGPHATPNSEIILTHLAVKSLVKINAIDACVKGITTNPELALWTLRYLHDAKAVDGLIAAYDVSKDAKLKENILSTLSRIYHEEDKYDGSWWWGTRPDTHGPYYKGVVWGESNKIKSLLIKELNAVDDSKKEMFAQLNDRNRMQIDELGTLIKEEITEEQKIDLDKIKNKKGQVGESSIEDIIVAITQIKGNAKLGAKLFIDQGCIACHNVEKGKTMKGPFMGQIGSIMNRDQIAESILKPNASISQGFTTVLIETNDDETYVGFVTAESADKLTIRDIAGNANQIEKKDIKSREELENSMMPSGLANALSFKELASLVTYLQQQK